MGYELVRQHGRVRLDLDHVDGCKRVLSGYTAIDHSTMHVIAHLQWECPLSLLYGMSSRT